MPLFFFVLDFFKNKFILFRVIFMVELEKTDKILKDFENRNELVKLEKFFVNAQLDNLPTLVEEKKNDIVKQIENYKMLYGNPITDFDGNVTGYEAHPRPFVVSNYFFRSITNLQNIEPQYNGEHLSILWDLYSYMVEQVNIYLCEFTPNLSHFCRFIGITSTGFKKLKNSSDDGIRIVAEKIYDFFYDEGVTMAQLGKHNTRATIYRMKSELERLEKEQPTVVINTNTVDLDSINKRIAEIGNFNKKVIDYSDGVINE